MYFLKTEMYIRYITKEVSTILLLKDPDYINEKKRKNKLSLPSYILKLYSYCGQAAKIN